MKYAVQGFYPRSLLPSLPTIPGCPAARLLACPGAAWPTAAATWRTLGGHIAARTLQRANARAVLRRLGHGPDAALPVAEP